MDIVYVVCYDGVHRTGILCVTNDEKKAIERANDAQGFRVEKWENGRQVNRYHYDGRDVIR